MKRIILTILLTLCNTPVLASELAFPPLTGRVVDTANEIPDDQEKLLSNELASFGKKTGHQLVVATIPSLQGEDIKEYSNELARYWKLGRAGANDGVLLLQTPGDGKPGSGKIRIEVGTGLEYILTDAMTRMIIEDQMISLLKQDKPRSETTPAALIAGAREIMRQAAITPEQKAEFDKAAAEVSRKRSQEMWDSLSNFLLICFGVGGVAFGWWLVYLLSTKKSRALRKKRDAENQAILLKQREEERLKFATRAAQERLDREFARRNNTNSTLYTTIPYSTRANQNNIASSSIKPNTEAKTKPTRYEPIYSPPIISPTFDFGSSSSSSSDDDSDSFSGGGGDFGGGGSDSSY